MKILAVMVHRVYASSRPETLWESLLPMLFLTVLVGILIVLLYPWKTK